MPEDSVVGYSVVEDIAAQARRKRVLILIESHRHVTAETELESQLSINDWAMRVQEAVKSAHALCRAGAVMEEFQAWLDVACIAAARGEDLLRVMGGEETREVVSVDDLRHTAEPFEDPFHLEQPTPVEDGQG